MNVFQVFKFTFFSQIVFDCRISLRSKAKCLIEIAIRILLVVDV